MVNPAHFPDDDAAPAPAATAPAPVPPPAPVDVTPAEGTGTFTPPIALMPLAGLAGLTDTGEGVCGPDGCF